MLIVTATWRGVVMAIKSRIRKMGNLRNKFRKKSTSKMRSERNGSFRHSRLVGPTPYLDWTWRAGAAIWPLGPLLPGYALRGGLVLRVCPLQKAKAKRLRAEAQAGSAFGLAPAGGTQGLPRLLGEP
ncbi:Hypothetical predicted protein [Prunus dulcis]|uniref:Uncharacterized protein n=1 Tax=Prunus dulcis TaxID=3755 RepID=A0A5E4EY21_PRUDU|nr:hypothetical protein L3X38_012209 [Prunus dulcis]VVA20573.1 Hypothetical predicted protein [Prunus dulcis]